MWSPFQINPEGFNTLIDRDTENGQSWMLCFPK